MDPSSCKYYHEDHIDSKSLYDIYVGPTAIKYFDEIFKFPLKAICSDLKSGCIGGSSLIDISTGAILFHLLPFCKYFKDITILEFNESCVQDLQKWLNQEDDSFDWSHAAKIVAELEGNTEKWVQKEDDLRRCVTHILKSDFAKENPTDPIVLPKVDCVVSLYVLGTISKDLESYCHNLKIISSMLKLGGRLILFGFFNSSFFIAGGHKYHVLHFNEEDLRKALKYSGFSVERMEVKECKTQHDSSPYDHVFFVNAAKKED
ncbi:nicotinamide N-methyltransferase-like [Pelobates fuscus]|uniref:nicotinamide N-methyltransferase-like n=1 Tax=Pelobates fuscus TaxID=191477 RepID=UPI002FE4EFCF